MSRIAIVLLGVAMLAGCIPPPPTPAQFEQKALSFLKDGQSTREELLLKLGEPTGQFEAQRILTYRMYSDPDGKTGVVRKDTFGADPTRPYWERTMFNLVLVFDRTVLARHSVVAVR